jgi:hypothetical protein
MNNEHRMSIFYKDSRLKTQEEQYHQLCSEKKDWTF